MKISLNELKTTRGRCTGLVSNALPAPVLARFSTTIEQSHLPSRESFFSLPPIEMKPNEQ